MNRSDIPPGVNRTQRRDSDPALNHSLLLQVLSNTNLHLAWKQVRSNGSAAGVDGITIEQYSDWIRPQWLSIRQQLLDGTYRPSPVKRVRIPKDDGTQRLIKITPAKPGVFNVSRSKRPRGRFAAPQLAT